MNDNKCMCCWYIYRGGNKHYGSAERGGEHGEQVTG